MYIIKVERMFVFASIKRKIVCFAREKKSDSFSKLGVNFINVFMRSFYALRSQKRKKMLDLTDFFALLGSACVKAAHKMLVKLTPGAERLLSDLIMIN